MQPTPFVTDFTTNPLTRAHQDMSSYLNNIQSKFSYADFKQRIVLLQNYEPLSKIIRRTKALKQQHEEKYKEEEGAWDWYQQEKLSNLQYLKKLENMVMNLKGKLQEYNWKKDELTAELEERRSVLKEMLKQNRDITYEILQYRQVFQSLDADKLSQKRSYSYNSLKNSKDPSVRPRKQSSQTHRSHRSTKSIRTVKYQNYGQNKFLFQQCLSQLSKSIKSTSASNIQGGIFLDLLDNNNQRMFRNKSESNNLVYQVLLNNYKEQQKKKNEQQDLMIEWETFKKFNGKQVIGLIMVKQKSLDCISSICQHWS